jgi:hypothetical protein
MSRFAICPAFFAALVVACQVSGARAQDFGQGFVNPGENAYASATPDDVAEPPAKIEDRLPIEIDDQTLAKALSYEPSLTSPGKTKSWQRSEPTPYKAKWDKTENRDGSASYSVTKPLAAPWDSNVGANLSTTAPPPDSNLPRVMPGTTTGTASGSAWANVAVPYVATVEVRAEPANGYDKFGTKIERSIPVGKSFSVTAQSTLGVTEMRSPTVPNSDAAARLFSTDNSLQLNVLATGTKFAAGTSTVTGDPFTHKRLSAELRVYGPLNVTGSISDPGQSSSNMSLTAGMNVTW